MNYDYIALEIGDANRLNRQALRKAIRYTVQIISNISPITAIDIAMSGYDDDPREIPEIPEARKYVLDFADGLMKAGIPLERLMPLSVQLIRLCIAVEEGIEIVVTDDPVDIDADLRAYRERARKKMQ